MGADQPGAQVLDLMGTPAPQRPAFIGFEHGRAKRRLPPARIHFEQVLGGVQHIQPAGVPRKQLLRRFRDDRGGFPGADAALEQVAHLAHQRNLPMPLFELT